MAMIAIDVPTNITDIINDINLPGECLKKEVNHHITMFYFEDELEMEDILKIIPIVYEVTHKTKPFIINTKTYSSFPKGKYGYPIVAQIKNKQVLSLRNEIKKAFIKNDIKFDQKYPDYKPHLTFEYNKKELDETNFNEIAWPINKITLFAGDKNKEQLLVEFPFGNIVKNSYLYLDNFSGYFEKLAINDTKIIKNAKY